MDVDDLKSINLKRGRDFGDALLKDVAHVIQNETPGDQRCFRVNGDWFSINLPGASSSDVTAAFGRIQQKLSGQCTLPPAASLTQTMPPPDADTLLQYAEIALDTSKAHGKTS